MPRSVHAASFGLAAVSTANSERVIVEVEALAAPDTLSRLLEPVVVMQAVPEMVSATLDRKREFMTVRLDLGHDRATAERLARKLEGAVTVASVRVIAEPALRAVSA